MRRGLRAMAVAGVLASGLAFATLLQSPSAAAQEGSGEPDLTEATLRLEDMPGEFGETADLFTIGGLITELLARAEGVQVYQHRVFADAAGTEVVESLLIGPLTSAEQDEFDAWFADEADMVQTVADSVPPFGNSGTWAVLDTTGLGDASFACWITATEDLIRDLVKGIAQPTEAWTRIEVALARRGPYLLVVAVTRDGAEDPIADAVDLARLLDRRLAEALGLSVGGFRPPGVLEPELTTHIPTPTDISTDPAVVGTNLLLAGLAMLAFVSADAVLDSTLARSEARLQRVAIPTRWLGRLQARLDAATYRGLHRGRWPDWVRLTGIVSIYGLVFSFLEPGWHPFSITGLYLFLTMAVSFGVVGHLSSMAKWAVARRFGLPTQVGLRPANLLLAAASLGFSRVSSLYPGLMMGTPVAYQIDAGSLEPPRQARLLGAGALALAGLAAGAWLLTIPTSLLQRTEMPGWVEAIVGGAQALLLVMFAVALQNLFREMLTLPGTAGHFLSRRHRLLWVTALLVITFAFWHTLINPGGELAAALQTANVRFFLAVVGAFALFTAGVWAYARHRARTQAAPAEASASPDAPPGPVPPGEAPPAGRAAEVAGETTPIAAASAGPPAGWHPDPTGRHQQRYWDGVRWTAWVADGGEQDRDPLRGG